MYSNNRAPPGQGYPVNPGQFGGQGNVIQYRAGPSMNGQNPPMSSQGPPMSGQGPMFQGPLFVPSTCEPSPATMLQPRYVAANPIPMMVPQAVPICAPLMQPPQPVFLPSTQSLSSGSAPLYPTSRSPSRGQQESYQGHFRPQSLFSPPPQNAGSREQPLLPPMSPVPPPLFRPGPQTPKAPTMKEDRQLNKIEKEDLYRTFGVVLQQHGPLEVTDSRLLSVFMGLSPWMRQGIKYLGGLKDFFRQGAMFKIDGDVVSLAWQEEKTEEVGKSLTATKSAPRTSPSPQKAPSEPSSDTAKKGARTKTSSQSTKTSQSGQGDPPKSTEGRHAEESSTSSEKKDPKSKEVVKQLVMTSTPTLAKPHGPVGAADAVRSHPLKERTMESPLSWEESAIAQEAEVHVAESSQECWDTEPVNKSWPNAAGDADLKECWEDENMNKSWPSSVQALSKGNDGKLSFPDVTGSLRGRMESEEVQEEEVVQEEVPEEAEEDVQKEVQEEEAEGEAKEEAVEEAEEEEDDDEGEALVYRSGSLHQAEGDVILVEVVEEAETANDAGEEEEEVVGSDTGEVDESLRDITVVEEDELEPEQEVVVVSKPEQNNGSQRDIMSATDGKSIAGVEGNEGEEEEEGTKVKDAYQETGGTQDIKEDGISDGIETSFPDVVAMSRNVAVPGEESEIAEKESSAHGRVARCQGNDATSEKDGKAEQTKGAGDVFGGEKEAEKSPSKGQRVRTRSVGVVTSKPQQSHKAINTREVKTRSCKVNTLVLPTISRGVSTGEDPQLEQLRSSLAKESQRSRVLSSDLEDLRDNIAAQKNQHASDSKSIKQQLDKTTKELTEYQRKLHGKSTVQMSELHKATAELKDSESRLNAAKSRISRAEKENSNLTRELEKTTRQLLDMERSHTVKSSCVSQITSTEGLEPTPDPAAEGEIKLLKMRARSAEQKVLELQYQYAMQSLNQALQESQYIFRMYGNSLLSSSHRELLRMKWMDYQMYIKEKTDEVASVYYSALKSLSDDVPFADIPSLKAQHVETFNPYKQSAGDGSGAALFRGTDPMAAPTQTFPVAPGASGCVGAMGSTAVSSMKAPPGLQGAVPQGAGLPGAGVPGASLPGAGLPGACLPGAGLPGAGLPGAGLTGAGLPGAGLPGAGLPGASLLQQAAALSKRPPGLPNLKMGEQDLSLPFMQAQTQRAAPGKVMRRVPRKPSKAFLAANFMSSLQHTTKVYGAKASGAGMEAGSGTPVVPDWGTGQAGGKHSPSLVHDWLDTMGADESAAPQAPASKATAPTPSVPPGFAGPQSATPFDTAKQPESTESAGPTEPATLPLHSGLRRPAGIGRGKAVSPNDGPPPMPSLSEPKVAPAALQPAVSQKAYFTDLSEAAASLSTTSSRTSSLSASQPTSPFLSDAEQSLEEAGQSRATKESQSDGKARSVSSGGAARSPSGGRGAAMGAGASPTKPRPGGRQGANQFPRQAPGSGRFIMVNDPTGSNVPPRFRARQLRMPYHRAPEGGPAGVQEGGPAGAGSGSEGSGDHWTTKVSKRKRKALNLVEQQTQLMKEYRHLTRSCDTKPAGTGVGGGQGSKKQGSLDKLINYLAKQFKHMSRKEMTDAILRVRLDHNGSLSGIAMGTIISEASSYLSRSEKKKTTSGLSPLCAVCQDELDEKLQRKLDCGHTFHIKCIKVWVNSEGTCPVCRKHTLFAEDFPRLM